MSTPTEICNLALTHLGIGKEIANLDSENSQEANACRRVFDVARQTTLRAMDWPFARKQVFLGLVTDFTALTQTTGLSYEWNYSYQVPSDSVKFLKILSLTRNDTRQSRVPYSLRNGTQYEEVYTDMQNAQGRYTLDVTDSSRFPADFVLGLSYKIAFLIAPRLTKGDPYKLKKQAEDEFFYTISRAKASALNEEQEEEDPDSEFIRERN